MIKLAFVGDPHLDSTTPRSRIDDYRETSVGKLYKILDLCMNEGVTKVFFTGDMFHKFEKVDQPMSYMNTVIKALRNFKNNGIELYTVIGNHDLPHNSFLYFRNTPLYALIESGLINHLTTDIDTVEGVVVHGLDFTQINNIPQVSKNNTKNILVMHYATDNTIPGESIDRELLSDFDVVVTGHDHTYFGVDGVNPTMVRPGSMIRRNKDEVNRKIIIPIISVDNGIINIVEHELPIEPADKVFKNDVFYVRQDIETQQYGYDKVFTSEFFKSRVDGGLDEIIDNLPEQITEQSKDKIKRHLKSEGVL